jgi:hypothetical protein
VLWFDPRRGGALRAGTVAGLEGGARAAIGAPPEEPGEDWLAVIARSQ